MLCLFARGIWPFRRVLGNLKMNNSLAFSSALWCSVVSLREHTWWAISFHSCLLASGLHQVRAFLEIPFRDSKNVFLKDSLNDLWKFLAESSSSLGLILESKFGFFFKICQVMPSIYYRHRLFCSRPVVDLQTGWTSIWSLVCLRISRSGSSCPLHLLSW